MAASPTIETIRDNMVSELNTISPDIGVVHDRPRRNHERNNFETLFKDTDGKIRTWWVNVVGNDDEQDPADHLFLVRRDVTIEGWLQLEDANDSYNSFWALVDSIQSKLRRNTTIFGTAPLRTEVTSTAVVDEQSFGDVLCHHASITFQVESEETIT